MPNFKAHVVIKSKETHFTSLRLKFSRTRDFNMFIKSFMLLVLQSLKVFPRCRLALSFTWTVITDSLSVEYFSHVVLEVVFTYLNLQSKQLSST